MTRSRLIVIHSIASLVSLSLSILSLSTLPPISFSDTRTCPNGTVSVKQTARVGSSTTPVTWARPPDGRPTQDFETFFSRNLHSRGRNVPANQPIVAE